MKWAVFLGIVLFIGVVIYSTLASAQVECEVCLEFDGETVCRRGAGDSEETATRAAQESVCGGNANGMSEVIACRAAIPTRVQCSTG
jgi:hypothetical protein